MADNTKIKYDTKNLDDFLKRLKDDHYLKVGIIGSKAHTVHKDSKETNAEIGSKHEFGVPKKNLPRRSFLEDSLKLKLNFDREQLKNLKNQLFKNLCVKGSIKQFLTQLGAECLSIIEEGFNTNGFGQWQPLSLKRFAERYEKSIKAYNRLEGQMLSGKVPYNRKMLDEYLNEVHNPHILTDTGQMRKSISFKVLKRK